MPYIEDLYPANILYRQSFYKFMDWCEQRDKYTKSLDDMRYCDWVIHKKLGAVKHFDKTYIIQGRGNGKSLFYHECVDEEDPKHITFTRIKDNPKPDRTDIDTIKAAIIDRDIYCPDLINEKLAEEIGEYVHEAFRRRLLEEDRKTYITTSNPYDWKPIIRPDGYVLDTKYTDGERSEYEHNV